MNSVLTSKARARHEAKRLGLCRLYDLPHVHLHAVAQNSEFVDQGYVHPAEDILEELGEFSALGARDLVNLDGYLAVKRFSALGAPRCYATNYPGRVLDGVGVVSGIHPLRRVG